MVQTNFAPKTDMGYGSLDDCSEVLFVPCSAAEAVGSNDDALVVVDELVLLSLVFRCIPRLLFSIPQLPLWQERTVVGTTSLFAHLKL